MIRIGHGYDVHRLCEGRKLILGGVHIPYEKGLLGHSDADVLTHALMDSLLGACALGDIGKHFPPDDPKYEGASSIELLRQVTAILRENGYIPYNADCTVVMQSPKLLPYIGEMRLNLAKAMGTDISFVSVKATTEERLGFTGTGEGAAAHAVCTVMEYNGK
ncbi:MAG: 2-C-methyl-D-erythritol 2,4-cyclodiphosphate synthase [Oscillospiraceae bacterium]|nr:2-C-methyl-D-erythritol 2,4-cyclodiphosphate synthase [Oscillospiraceae bacterium]